MTLAAEAIRHRKRSQECEKPNALALKALKSVQRLELYGHSAWQAEWDMVDDAVKALEGGTQ